MTEIHGVAAPGFGRVKDVFARNFEEQAEVGAAFSLYHRGEKVVDLWGGLADRDTKRPWEENTIQMVASTTKGATAVCANLLVQRGELDLDAPVAKYWPEFAAGGKQDVPVRWLLSHRVGLPIIETKMTMEEFLAWDPVVEALASQTPVWEPGTAHGYHALTYGHLVGEVVRRITGKSLGRFFKDEVATPLGLDFWIGLPESEEHRVSPMIQDAIDAVDVESLPEETRNTMATLADPDSLLARGSYFLDEPMDMNARAFHAAEIPAGNGITDARSLARMYASLIGDGVDGIRLFTDDTVKNVTTEQSNGQDQVLLTPSRLGLGFALHGATTSIGQEGAFGHAGAGGSLGFADPKAGFGFGYVMNCMQVFMGNDPRTLGLIAAAHKSIAG